MKPPASDQQFIYTRRRLIVATAAVLVPAVAYSQFRRGNTRSEASNIEPTAPPTSATPPATQPGTTTAAPPVTPAPKMLFDHDIGPGMTGTKVVALQDRLRTIGFDPGPSDGSFGPATERAVWAFEKFVLGTAVGDATGVVTNAVWEAMSDDIEVRPRRANPGTHLEVLLPQQVAVLYMANQVRLITHISSGSGDEWCDVVTVDNDDGSQSDQGICGVAVTPGGVFHFERRVDGWRNSKLGRLYNPVYFNYGIAVHGASNVPDQPVSHGCVRIPMHIAEYFPSLVTDGDLVYVFDGVEEPETYGAQLPVFDYPDPEFTTTTSSTAQTSTSTIPRTPRTSVEPTSTPPSTHPHPPTTTTTTTTTSQIGEPTTTTSAPE